MTPQSISVPFAASAVRRGVRTLITAGVLASAITACSPKKSFVAGTKIPDSQENIEILKVLETYRGAMETRNVPQLVLLASPDYFEDGGTPSVSDDYGYEGLREVLAGRFGRAEDIRYSIRYEKLQKRCPNHDESLAPGCQARVEVLIDASFSVRDSRGQVKRPDKRDQNELVLEWNGDKWLITSGM